MVMTEETTDLAGALSPILEARGLDLVDVELHGAQLTVFVDQEGGVGLESGVPREAVPAGAQLLIVLGGDGTLS